MVNRTRQVGFTIVELLIVIVIIGILAAIVIVAYNGITSQARESAVKSDLANARKKLTLYKVDNGTFPIDASELTSVKLTTSESAYDMTQNNFYYCALDDGSQFALGARTVSTSKAYIINSLGELEERSNVYGDHVCQSIGLEGWQDTNGFFTSGATGGNWSSWVSS